MAEAKSAAKKPRKARERRRDKEVRPQQIVAAAFEEFAEKGFAGARLEDVASRAKVSKGLPYLYFKTKVELFKAVIRSVITSHFEVIREEMETTDLSVEDFLKGPFLALHPGSRRLAPRLHRAAPDRRRTQASGAHRVLLRGRDLARHGDAARSSSIAASRAASSRPRACATFRSSSSRRCSPPSSGGRCSSATITSIPTRCLPPISSCWSKP